MADYKVVDAEKLEAGLIATADAIREKTGNTEKIDWKENGMADQVDEVFEAGKKSEYDRFWDTYQINGTRRDYNNAFSGKGWDESTFLPKYDIYADSTYMLFRYSNFTDLEESIIKAGITVTLNSDAAQYSFSACQHLKVIGAIVFAKPVQRLDFTFSWSSKLEEIRVSIPISETTILNCFDGCISLRTVAFKGTIGNDLNTSSCPLSRESILGIIENLSSTSSSKTLTLKLSAVNNAFETSPGAADGSASEEWLTLANTKPNWTISLV